MLRGIEYGVRAIVLLFLLRAAALAQDSRANDAAKALHDLFAAEWDYQMEQHPTWASSLGDRRWNDRWSDISLDAIFKRHDHDIATLNKLTKIDRGALSPADQLNYDLFKKDYENDIEDFQYRWYLLPLNQLGGVHTVNQLAEVLRFDTLKDYETGSRGLKRSRPHRSNHRSDAAGNQRTNHSSEDRLATSSSPDRSSHCQRSESESAL